VCEVIIGLAIHFILLLLECPQDLAPVCTIFFLVDVAAMVAKAMELAAPF
jgi:hypothetical protein